MNKKGRLFDVKRCLLLILIVNVTADVNLGKVNAERKIPRLTFRDTLHSIPREFIRVISVTKQMGKVLERIINLPRNNRDSEEIENNLRTIFDYLYDGFEFLDNVTRSNNANINLMNRLLLASKYNQTTFGFYKTITNIETIFNDRFVNIIKYYNSDKNREINNFFNKTIFNEDFRNSITLADFCHSPKKVNAITNKTITKNIFQMYFETLQDELNVYEVCNISITKLIIDFYERVLIDILKGYTMIVAGYELFRVKQLGYAVQEIQNSYFEKYINTTKNVLYSANKLNYLITVHHKTYKRCDPGYWNEGKNYIRVKNYVSDRTGFIARNNRDFKPLKDQVPEYECGSFSLLSNFKFESIDTMKCPEIFETNPPYDSICSYSMEDEFIAFENNYTNWNLACYEKTSYYTILKTFCYCDKHSNRAFSIRRLSLREHYTDSADSRVVTGIRFAVKNNIISIEIQEGKLVNGTVDPNTVRWITDDGIPPSKGPDVIKLSYKIKSFDLDDIELPNGYFVTGVKFQWLNNNHISLVVRGTGMWEDYESWSSSDHRFFYPVIVPEDFREKIDTKDYKNSAELIIQNVVLSHSGWNYVDLSVGLLSSQFNNLPVIPFFDSQIVAFNPPAPLGGLGLVYKGQPGYGGFIAFQIIASKYTYDIYSEMTYFNKF